MSHWKSNAKLIKEIKRRNKKRKENQIFNFIWVISQTSVKIEGVYFNYWFATLAVRKQCIFQKCPCKVFLGSQACNYKGMQIKRAEGSGTRQKKREGKTKVLPSVMPPLALALRM